MLLRSLVFIGAFFIYFETAVSQPEIISSNGRLSYDFGRPNQFIPIDATPGYPPKIVWVRQRPNFDFEITYAVRDSQDSWRSRVIGIFTNERVNIWSGRDGTTFIYIDYGQQFFEQGDSLVLRYGDLFDVMDSLGCFHFLFRGYDSVHLMFSDDTLTTWQYGDTLSLSLRQIGVAVSPDRGLVAAAFIDYNILNKFIAPAGQPLTISNPVISVFDYGIDDYAIDNAGLLYIAYSPWGDSTWKERYVWSEQNGSRYLHPLYDFDLNGSQAQLAFCPSRNLVLLLESNVYALYDSCTISFSTDNGDTWLTSLVHPAGGNASTPRLVVDTLYVASQLTEENQVLFQKFAVDDIISNYVPVESDPIIPAQPSLTNYPNPFNSSTTISFSLPAQCRSEISIFDISGREIIRLFDGITSGSHSVTWNGVNDAGNPVSSGLYFCRLHFDSSEITRKLILIR